MTEAAFIIRFCYDPQVAPAREVQWRLRHFAGNVLPRLRAQDTPADVWVWVHEHDRAALDALDVRTFTVNGAPGRRRTGSMPWASVRGLPRYPVQLLLGSDDYIGPAFVSTALRELAAMTQARALVTFQPWKYDLISDSLWHMRPYRVDRASPFLALRQPLDDRYGWVWDRGHTKQHRNAQAVKVIPEGHAALVVHRYNDSTTIVPTDRLAGRGCSL